MHYWDGYLFEILFFYDKLYPNFKNHIIFKMSLQDLKISHIIGICKTIQVQTKPKPVLAIF